MLNRFILPVTSKIFYLSGSRWPRLNDFAIFVLVEVSLVRGEILDEPRHFISTIAGEVSLPTMTSLLKSPVQFHLLVLIIEPMRSVSITHLKTSSK